MLKKIIIEQTGIIIQFKVIQQIQIVTKKIIEEDQTTIIKSQRLKEINNTKWEEDK